ncbi:MAG TPA: SufE family protein [Candidatus Poseidoniaceae archaeon]|nr:MAG TPA: SufE family protein [Candidatus Poseidoniales archaeon]HII44966.1 SufE family protein [Candidatus Poseidoniaceae archaeon]
MTYSKELSELIDEFQDIEDKMERLEMVFDLAEEVNLLPIEQWNDNTRVQGCQSEAHVRVEVVNSNVNFYSGADSKLVQGLMGILTMAIHGVDADMVLELTPEFATEMGILNSLSPSRSNGFRNMFDKVMKEIKLQV